MVIVFTGGRSYYPTHEDFKWVFNILSDLAENDDPLVILTGGAKGVDREIERYCNQLRSTNKVDLVLVRMNAEWSKHGRSAGMKRNKTMVDQADLCVAFPGGKGTQDCVDKARRKGIPIIEHIGRLENIQVG